MTGRALYVGTTEQEINAKTVTCVWVRKLHKVVQINNKTTIAADPFPSVLAPAD